jgi:hypothetical protein
MFKLLPIYAVLVIALLQNDLQAGDAIVKAQSWSNPEGIPEFAVYVNCCSGTPWNYNPKHPFLTEITMAKNSGGFVTVQGKITNKAPWRKTFRMRWEWKSPNGIMSTAPSDAALTMMTLAGKEQEVIQGTSTVPNPAAVVLTLFPHAK